MLLRQRREHPRPRADAAMEGGELVFLVGRMDAVVVETEADHQRIHSEEALEGTDDGDRAAGADDRGVLMPFGRKGLARLLQERSVEGKPQRRAAAMGLEVDL